METISHLENSVRFGNFEFDPRTRELHRNGARLKIRGHPVDVLAILLEHPGELVTRETLQKRLWPDDTFVDFEHILNNSIVRLREALGDNAEKPKYVETLPRLGYRFIAHLDCDEANHRSQTQQEIMQSGPSTAVEHSAPKRISRKWIVWSGAALLMVCSIVVWWFLRAPLPPLRVTSCEQLTLDGYEKRVIGADANRIFLTVRDPRSIAQIPVSGGELTYIPFDLSQDSGSDGGLMDVSPDGRDFLVAGKFDREGGYSVWIAGAAGRPARYFTKAFAAAWSPDGRNIVFANARGDVYVMGKDADTPKLIHLESSPLDQITPTSAMAWSPNGRTIRFTRRDKGRTIWEIDSDGTNLHEWLPGWNESAPKCCGRWTPDGQFYLFLSGSGVGQGPQVWPLSQIWAADERRSVLHSKVRKPFPLAQGPLLWGTPIPSHDGKKIFVRGVSLRGELEKIDQKSNRLVPFLNGISAEMTDFSRDGKDVVYVSFPEGILWRAKRDGSGPVQLTKPGLYVRNPRWSPDGARILFTSNTPNGIDHLYLISSNGGAPERLLPDEAGPLSFGDWSPDGKKIVSVSTRFGFNVRDTKTDELRIIEVATGKFTVLPKRPGGLWAPLWSPDGRYIAGHPRDEVGLVVFDLREQTYRSLPRKTLLGFHNWSRDSKYLYFNAESGGSLHIFRIRVQDGKEERVFDYPEGFRGTGWYNFWMSLDPEDAPIALRNAGTDEIYALTLDRK